VNRPALVVHGHFYQPPRLDPFTDTMPLDPTAAPWHDWNERISADCYRPNAELGNVGAISWDLGPTLAGWMERGDPVAYRGFVDGDAGRNGMAQPFHHTILPLASAADRVTEVRWGLRDFEVRFGRRSIGVWLPETAVDLSTLRLLAQEGVTYTILAPWQVAGSGEEELDTRRPVRIDLGDGRSMVAVIYDGLLSAAVSFEPAATVDADAFVREQLVPRLTQEPNLDTSPPLVVIATDGELYGHHRTFREHFLARLVGRTAPPDRSFDTPPLDAAIAQASADRLAVATIRERTSWSCHHGIDRWTGDCGCVPDGAWKRPLRATLDRLAGGVDAATDHAIRSLSGAPDPWRLRDAWIDVVLGVRSAGALVGDLHGPMRPEDLDVIARLMEAQRWRLAMYASCAWFWDRADRIETAGALRAAARAARLVDAVAGTDLERRLVDDLRLIEADGIDGVVLLDVALRAVGAPLGLASGTENPSARGLRATG
jgi:Domain of unknown function (DUF3536)/Glycosyl hydrolase family 57